MSQISSPASTPSSLPQPLPIQPGLEDFQRYPERTCLGLSCCILIWSANKDIKHKNNLHLVLLQLLEHLDDLVLLFDEQFASRHCPRVLFRVGHLTVELGHLESHSEISRCYMDVKNGIHALYKLLLGLGGGDVVTLEQEPKNICCSWKQAGMRHGGPDHNRFAFVPRARDCLSVGPRPETLTLTSMANAKGQTHCTAKLLDLLTLRLGLTKHPTTTRA